MSRVFSSNKGIQKYGMKFPENMDELGIELYCYAISRGEYGKEYCVKHNINLTDFKLLFIYFRVKSFIFSMNFF